MTGTWTNPTTNLPVDPTNASVDVTDPTGATNTYTFIASQVTRVSQGIFTYAADTTAKPGRWQYRWWSPGPNYAGAAQYQFIVDPYPTPVP